MARNRSAGGKRERRKARELKRMLVQDERPTGEQREATRARKRSRRRSRRDAERESKHFNDVLGRAVRSDTENPGGITDEDMRLLSEQARVEADAGAAFPYHEAYVTLETKERGG